MRSRVIFLAVPARWRRWLGFYGLSLAGLSVLTCQWVAGIDDRTIYDAAITPDGANPCARAAVPDAPPLTTSSSTDSVTLLAALSSVAFGDTDAGPFYGFNLDKECTCPGPDSCQRGGVQAKACDDPGGIDNYARRIFETVNLFTPLITEQKLNDALTSGLSGVLIQVSSYNGKADDGEVTVTVFASLGFENYPTPPKFDGTDHWKIEQDTAAGQFSTTNAYVANYQLVASLSFPIIIGSAVTQPVRIQLDAGLITAKLDMTDASYGKMTNGILGGRWDPAKFLPSLQSVPDPINDGGHLCGDSGTYQELKAIICSNTDVNASPANDGTGLCNSVSMGLGFEAVPALEGSILPTPVSSTPCGPTWSDKCM